MRNKRMTLLPALVLISLALLSLTPTYAARASRWDVTFSGDLVGSGKLSSNLERTCFSGSFPLTFGGCFNSYAGYHGDCLIKILRTDGSDEVDVIVDFGFVKTSTGKTYKSLWGRGIIRLTDSTFCVVSSGKYSIYEIAVQRGLKTPLAMSGCQPSFTINGALPAR